MWFQINKLVLVPRMIITVELNHDLATKKSQHAKAIKLLAAFLNFH